jgi:hypothetical protein
MFSQSTKNFSDVFSVFRARGGKHKEVVKIDDEVNVE